MKTKGDSWLESGKDAVSRDINKGFRSFCILQTMFCSLTWQLALLTIDITEHPHHQFQYPLCPPKCHKGNNFQTYPPCHKYTCIFISSSADFFRDNFMQLIWNESIFKPLYFQFVRRIAELPAIHFLLVKECLDSGTTHSSKSELRSSLYMCSDNTWPHGDVWHTCRSLAPLHGMVPFFLLNAGDL